MTSPLRQTFGDLLSGALAKIINAGYPFNRFTTSLDKYLGAALAGMTGGPNLYLSKTRVQLLSGIAVALGGTGNVLTTGELQLLANIEDSGAEAGYTGPLDIVPDAVVAYSQRAMAAAWTSNALTIRRDSDDATQSFATTVSNAVDAAAVSAFIGGGAGFVAAWKDQSGNAKDMLQAVNADQPTWTASVTNGRPGLSFDGIAQFLATAGNVTFSSGTFTIFFVFKTTFGNNSFMGMNAKVFDHDVMDMDQTRNHVAFDILGADGEAYGSNTNISDLNVGPHITVIALTGSAGVWVIDGVSVPLNYDSAPTSIGAVSNRLALGANDASGNNFWLGTCLEFFAYDSVLSDPNILAVNENIAAYYGITLP